jgi:phosphoglycerate dehydrogenase-like enzyme
MPPESRQRVIDAFPHIEFANVFTREEVTRHIVDADAAFVPGLTGAEILSAPRLRWLHTQAAGVGHMLSPELLASDIVLTNSRGVRAPAIAEHVMAMVLVLARQLHTMLDYQRQRIWAQETLDRGGRMWTLAGRTMGIVGVGSIGERLAPLAAGFGMTVKAVRRRIDAPLPPGVCEVLPPDRLHDLLASSDVVVLAAALTPDTEGLIGTPELAVMQSHAVLVNVGRGGLVREPDLIAALQRGVIGGAALDVFADEPLDPESPLWTLPNVIISPHVSGTIERYWETSADLFIENLRRFEAGEPLVNVVDKAAGY